jgi:hypothetical protein
MAKNQPKVLVIGTRHEYQRHQDTDPEREEIRAAFERRLRQAVKGTDATVIAEEAGDDTAVWNEVKSEEEGLGEFADKFAEAFGGGRTVAKPVPTIAKTIRDEQPEKLEYVDIRAPNAEKLSIAERDEAMASEILKLSKNANSIVTIVGEDHRAGVAKRLNDGGLSVACFRFP